MTSTASKYLPPGRCPVCESIESLLQTLESKGKGKLQVCDHEGSVRLDFGGVKSDGVTRDIALVRLASAMIDDARYRRDVVVSLRKPVRASQRFV